MHDSLISSDFAELEMIPEEIGCKVFQLITKQTDFIQQTGGGE